METITFSIFEPAGYRTYIQSLAEKFEQEKHIHVEIEEVEWADGWKRLVDSALYGRGPDVSDIGNTWVIDLANMNVLRPFSDVEIQKIMAGKEYFQPCIAGSKANGATWSIPFIGDARVVFYRKSMLAQAGVAEENAFQTIDAFEKTLLQLKNNGAKTALSLPTQSAAVNLQSLASWIWHCGGDLFSQDGKELIFDKPEALNGIKAYFRLGNYIGEDRLNQPQAEQLFRDGNAAVHISGHWLFKGKLAEGLIQDVGVAPTLNFQDTFVGAEHLVVWKHSRRAQAALEFVEFVCNKQSNPFLFPHFGLPPYEEAWQKAPFNNPEYAVQHGCLQAGRSYPNSTLRALVEKRLVTLLPTIWDQVLQNPSQADLIVEKEIKNLAKRLRLTIEN